MNEILEAAFNVLEANGKEACTDKFVSEMMTAFRPSLDAKKVVAMVKKLKKSKKSLMMAYLDESAR